MPYCVLDEKVQQNYSKIDSASFRWSSSIEDLDSIEKPSIDDVMKVMSGYFQYRGVLHEMSAHGAAVSGNIFSYRNLRNKSICVLRKSVNSEAYSESHRNHVIYWARIMQVGAERDSHFNSI